jgi:hypothetical protein
MLFMWEHKSEMFKACLGNNYYNNFVVFGGNLTELMMHLVALAS